MKIIIRPAMQYINNNSEKKINFCKFLKFFMGSRNIYWVCRSHFCIKNKFFLINFIDFFIINTSLWNFSIDYFIKCIENIICKYKKIKNKKIKKINFK